MRPSPIFAVALLAARVDGAPRSISLHGKRLSNYDTLNRRAELSASKDAPVRRDDNIVNVPLTDWISHNADIQWYGTISVGTPPQNFTVIFDTGSTEVIIPAVNCSTCASQHLFDPAQSSTFSAGPDSEHHALPEVTGPKCKYHQDTISIGGDSVPGYDFLLCDEYPDFMQDMAADGILGLGLDGIFWDMYYVNEISLPQFSLYLVPGHPNQGELTLGGTNPARYEGDIFQVPFHVGAHYETWTLDVPAIRFNNVALTNSSNNGQPVTNNLAIVDTGTASMLAPDQETAADLYSQISNEIQPIDNFGTWGAPCETVDRVAVDVTFTVGPPTQQVNLTIPKEYFNLGEVKPGLCQAVFAHSVPPVFSGHATWIIGSPMLKFSYTVWNPNDGWLGFATPRRP